MNQTEQKRRAVYVLVSYYGNPGRHMDLNPRVEGVFRCKSNAEQEAERLERRRDIPTVAHVEEFKLR